MNHASDIRTFTLGELVVAVAGAAVAQLIVTVLFFYLKGEVRIEDRTPPPPPVESIAVKPVLDDLPLLAKGGKRPKQKLPDMWQKRPPVKRVEARSAPSPTADPNEPKAELPPVATKDEEVPKPDDEVIKEADELAPEESEKDPEDQVDGEGSPDGVDGGTETDPLKARQVSLYRAKIAAWFNARFSPPTSGAPCEELKAARARVVVQIDGDRRVSSFTVIPSGVGVFDAKVQATMASLVGQQLPPPPKLYPDLLDATVSTAFSGAEVKCEATARPPAGTSPPDAPAPDAPAPDAPAPDAAPSPTPEAPTPSDGAAPPPVDGPGPSDAAPDPAAP